MKDKIRDMLYIHHLDNDVFNLSMFLDFDKEKNVYYNNFYLEEYDSVIKIPLTHKKSIDEELKIEKLNLTKYTYLFDFD